MIQLAIIGPTASGKSDLAIRVAKKINACILSIDSLSIYKEINIVSAKPSYEELREVRHFGIDVLSANEYFSVDIFLRLYKEAVQKCQEAGKNLIIVGGTSFYLKMLVDGLSEIPTMDAATKEKVAKRLLDLQESYHFLYALDVKYMQNIAQNDRYRIEKALLIYEAAKCTPSEWFSTHPPKPVIENLPIYNIDAQRDVLQERIKKRTQKMFESGLIDEVCSLEQRYTRAPHSMNSIGIVEVLEYLDGKVNKEQMLENISLHTAQLAKRQQTFNRTQFESVIHAPLEELEAILMNNLL